MSKHNTHKQTMQYLNKYNPYTEVTTDPKLLELLDFEALIDKLDFFSQDAKQQVISKIFNIAEENLTNRQMQIFVLRYFFGLKEQEISLYIKTAKSLKLKIFPNGKLAKIYEQQHNVPYEDAVKLVNDNREHVIKLIRSSVKTTTSQPYVAFVLKRIEKKIRIIMDKKGYTKKYSSVLNDDDV